MPLRCRSSTFSRSVACSCQAHMSANTRHSCSPWALIALLVPCQAFAQRRSERWPPPLARGVAISAPSSSSAAPPAAGRRGGQRHGPGYLQSCLHVSRTLPSPDDSSPGSPGVTWFLTSCMIRLDRKERRKVVRADRFQRAWVQNWRHRLGQIGCNVIPGKRNAVLREVVLNCLHGEHSISQTQGTP